jgi:hypothetical protein
MDAMHGSKPSRDNGCRGHRPITDEDLIADGLTTQTAQEWLAHRRRRRAVLTPRAWDGIKAEAAKAGITPADAVRVSATNSWQGFRATWYAKQGQEGGAARGPAATGTHGGYENRNYGQGGAL